MDTKIPVTKAELLEIANIEFRKEPSYRENLTISDVEMMGHIMKFEVLTNSTSEVLAILNSQDLATRLSDKYQII